MLIAMSCNSQTPIYTLGQSPINKPKNSYVKDTNNVLNKFSGTWQFSNNGETFKIFMNKAVFVNLSDYYVDELRGNFYYQKNGNVIDTNIPTFTNENSTIYGFTLWEGNPNKVTLFFDDPERPKMSCRVTLTYSNNNGIEKLHWDLKLVGLPASRDPNMNPAKDFRVPTNVELIKQ